MWVKALILLAATGFNKGPVEQPPRIVESHRIAMDCDGPCAGESVTFLNPRRKAVRATIHCGGHSDYVDLINLKLEPMSRLTVEIELIGPDPGPEPVCRIESWKPDGN